MILQADFPPDIRLEKEISTLRHRFRILLLCNNGQQQAREEALEGVSVFRLPGFSSLPARLATLLRLPLFFNPVWLWAIFKLARRFQVDALHVHDLPLATSALWIGRLLKRPVVYDMHENYPAVMQIWQQDSIVNKLIKNHHLARLLDRSCIKKADRLVAVVQERKQQLVDDGIPAEKIAVVSNTIRLDDFLNLEIDQSIVQKYRAFYTLVYIGFFSSERGLFTVISALTMLNKKINNLKLVLVGDGKDKKALQDYSKDLGVDHLIDFIPWIEFSLVPSYIHAGDVCIDPRPSNPANDTTISHKIFQYMALEKPLLTSDAKPFQRIINDCQCGTVFTSNDPESFANGVFYLHSSKKPFGKNGFKAVREHYNWNQSGNELERLYIELFNTRKMP